MLREAERGFTDHARPSLLEYLHLQLCRAFMAHEEEDLTQSKDTRPNSFTMYEAVLDDVLFDWISQSDVKDAEKECREYLGEFTNAYTIKKFYVKREHDAL